MCNDPGLSNILSVLIKIIDIIQIIVPIILIIALTIKLTQVLTNPDEKKEKKKIYNMAVAAILIFFIPMLVDMVLGMLPNTYKLSSCWESAKNTTITTTHQFINPNKKEPSKIINQSLYEKGNEKQTDTTDNSPNPGTITGSAKGEEIVRYALQFKGQAYKRGGRWNGELPYKPTDCFGFVTAIYKHFGYKLNWDDINKGRGNYEVVNPNDIRAGDIAYYDGHGAMFTGNGKQIIHAMNPKSGVGLTNDYKKCGKPLNGEVFVSSSDSHDRPTARQKTESSSVLKATVRESSCAGDSTATVREKQEGICPQCGYSLEDGICPSCGFGKEGASPVSDHPVLYGPPVVSYKRGADLEGKKTVRPIRKEEREGAFTLVPISEETGAPEGEPLLFEGDVVSLNRENTDPKNKTITSVEQAVISRVEGIWVVTDKSEYKTTFVQASHGIKLHDGDLLLLGNQLYSFKNKQ